VINRRKDGSLTPEEMTITPVALQAVDITHFIEINQDISERKQAEQSLLDAEEKYRAIFEDAVVGIFQATPDGRLLDSNRAFATMLGYESPEQLLADESRNSLSHVMNASHRNEWISILEKQGVIRSTELEVPCKDGTRKWVLVNARAVRNLDGVVVKHEGTVEGITDRKAAQMQIKFLAYYDALTGLPNRTLLQDRLTNALAAARRRGNLTAVLFLDLDRFKIINDSLGHSFGDLLLQQVATRLKNEVREQDTVARVGGDEFLIVLTSVESLSELELIAARIVESVSREFIIKGRTLGITCSLGISVFPEHGHDAETLVKNADSAMYCAKDKGSNSFCPFYR
jgi:diguanylate cyclase (GGDEF)-like protein/PAS domain S-box-containing protein